VQGAVPAAVASLPVWKQPRYLVHRVRRGETLSQIARRYHTSMRAIKIASRLRSIHRLRIGQRLRIPVRGR
jgi:membrane-bound lytic murein transglycosylase D